MCSRRPARLVALFLLATGCAHADSLVAVATNFAEAAKVLETDFEAASRFDVTLVFGSTGHLYAQIVNGAPYGALLAADRQRPLLLEESGLAVAGTRFTYAIGQLTLWSRDPERISADGAATLRNGQFRKLALANPQLAPYGAAAMEVLETLGLADRLQAKLVFGENVGQAYALVATGNADLGFVARAYATDGSRWDVPSDMHSPIDQDAVLLQHGKDDPAIVAFLRYVRSPPAQTIIAAFGYEAI